MKIIKKKSACHPCIASISISARCASQVVVQKFLT